LLLRFDGAGLDGGWSAAAGGILLPKSFRKIQTFRAFTAPCTENTPRTQALYMYNATPPPTQTCIPEKALCDWT
jgi:hypothetical protein